MKVSLLLAALCFVSSPWLSGAPNDSLATSAIDRWGIRPNPIFSFDNSPAHRPPFSHDGRLKPLRDNVSMVFDRQQTSSTSERAQDHNDLSDQSSSYFKPTLFAGGALAITAVLIKTDQQTYNIIHGWRRTSDPVEDVSPVITNLGDGRASIAIFGGFLAYSYLEKDRSAFQAGKVGLESFLVSGIVTQILKHTFGRERPSAATQSGGRWNGAFLLLNQGSGKRGSYAQYDSFPSGHTATIFAAATTLSEIYGNSPWVSYASYTVASSVAISRIMEQTHWLSDCFVGGLIGYFSTQVVLHVNHSAKPVALLPSYDGQHVGLSLNVGL